MRKAIKKKLKFDITMSAAENQIESHFPSEAMCGTCFFLGETECVEMKYMTTYNDLFCCFGLCAKAGFAANFHVTNHYCANCGILLASVDYAVRLGGAAARRQGGCDGWAIDPDEEDYELVKYEDVIATRKANKAQEE